MRVRVIAAIAVNFVIGHIFGSRIIAVISIKYFNYLVSIE